MVNFFSNFKFQNWKFAKKIFNFSKMNIFIFFHFKFSWHISVFFISLVWPNFSNFNSNFKIDFFQFFPFPFGGMAKSFSKFKKNQLKLQNWIFSNCFISNFPCGINNFFLSPRLPNLLKDCQNYLLPLQKIIIYYIPPPSGMVHCKRAFCAADQ
jgi:hypothetical protein